MASEAYKILHRSGIDPRAYLILIRTELNKPKYRDWRPLNWSRLVATRKQLVPRGEMKVAVLDIESLGS